MRSAHIINTLTRERENVRVLPWTRGRGRGNSCNENPFSRSICFNPSPCVTEKYLDATKRVVFVFREISFAFTRQRFLALSLCGNTQRGERILETFHLSKGVLRDRFALLINSRRIGMKITKPIGLVNAFRVSQWEYHGFNHAQRKRILERKEKREWAQRVEFFAACTLWLCVTKLRFTTTRKLRQRLNTSRCD